MIKYMTFSDTHLANTGARGLNKREKLRQQAEAYIAGHLEDEDLLCITESGDEVASSVTVWYRQPDRSR